MSRKSSPTSIFIHIAISALERSVARCSSVAIASTSPCLLIPLSHNVTDYSTPNAFSLKKGGAIAPFAPPWLRHWVKFLRSNGICLVKVTEDTDGCCDPSERPEDITVVPPLCTFTPTATQMVFPDQPVLKSGSNTSSQPPLQAEVCIVRSTFISPRMGKMLEVEIEVKSPPVKDVYFEPSCCSALKGLEIAEAVLISQQDGHLFIPIENHASLSQCLHPGTCIGRATQLPNAWEKFQSPRAAGTKFVNGDYH